jgi:hypothetical protein
VGLKGLAMNQMKKYFYLIMNILLVLVFFINCDLLEQNYFGTLNCVFGGNENPSFYDGEEYDIDVNWWCYQNTKKDIQFLRIQIINNSDGPRSFKVVFTCIENQDMTTKWQKTIIINNLESNGVEEFKKYDIPHFNYSTQEIKMTASTLS